jgi:hypothetical protein
VGFDRVRHECSSKIEQRTRHADPAPTTHPTRGTPTTLAKLTDLQYVPTVIVVPDLERDLVL